MLRSSILCRPSACRENGLSAGACIAPRCMSPGPETSTSKARTKQRAPLLDAFAGAVAGAVSRFAIGPLDVLKIRFQVQIEPLRPPPGSVGTALTSKYTGIKQAALTIFREEGIQGLWRGTVPGLLLTVPYTAVQFFTLQTVRNFAATSGLEQTGYTHLTSFGSGAIAGAAATAASYPFDLLRTTLAAQGEPKVYRGLIDAAQGIVRQQGVRGLYNGLSITLLEIMPYAALQFGLYDAFVAAHRRRALRQGTDPEDKVGHFFCGLAAGALAKMGTHPLDVAKKRFQVAGLQRSAAYGARIELGSLTSLPACLGGIYAREGLRGLYKGSIPSLIKAAPAAAITFSTYEAVLGCLAVMQAKAAEAGLTEPA